MLRPEQIKPLPGFTLVETVEVEEYASGIIKHTWSNHRYPVVGYVINSNSELHDLERNDRVVITDEGMFVDHSYYDCFQVILNDDGEHISVLVQSEAEPILREEYARWQANPSTYKSKIKLKDAETNEHFQFDPWDIVDFGFVDLAHPSYKLEYIHTHMLWLTRGLGEPWILHYIVHDSKLIATLEEEIAED